MVLRIMGDAGSDPLQRGGRNGDPGCEGMEEGVFEGLADYQAMLETVPIANEVSHANENIFPPPPPLPSPLQ